MSIGNLGEGQPSREEMMEMEEQRQKKREERQMAQQLAQQGAMEEGTVEPGYWDAVTDADIDDGHNNLEQYAAVELSSTNALSNITRSEYKSRTWRHETQEFIMRNEMRDGDSKMGADDERIMYGEESVELTDEKARQLRGLTTVMDNLLSLGVDAKALDAGTQIHAVTKTESPDAEEDESSGGWKKWLTG